MLIHTFVTIQPTNTSSSHENAEPQSHALDNLVSIPIYQFSLDR